MGKYTPNDLDPGAYKSGSLRKPADASQDLSAVALPDELEGRLKPNAVVDHVPGLAVSNLRRVGSDDLAERLNQWIVQNNALKAEAHSTIAALRAERDGVERERVRLWNEVRSLKSDLVVEKAATDTMRMQRDEFETGLVEFHVELSAAEARIKALEEALGNMRCPRPCNHRPDEFDAKDCVAAGECGCGAAVLSDGSVNAPS